MDLDLSSAHRFKWRSIKGATKFVTDGAFPDSLCEGTSTLCGSKLYTLGGVEPVLTLRVLDLTRNVWECRYLRRPPRRRPVVFLWDDFLYVYGGWHHGAVRTTFRVDIVTFHVEMVKCRWQGLPETFAGLNSCGSFCETSRELVLFGKTSTGLSNSYTLCFRVETRTFYAPRVKGELPSGRSGHSSCCVQNRFYLYGGRNGEEDVEFNDLHILTIRARSYLWSKVIPVESGIRHTVSTKLEGVPGRLFLIGGERSDMDSASVPTLAIYSLREQKWLEVYSGGDFKEGEGTINVEHPLSAIDSHSTANDGTGIIVIGGYKRSFLEYKVLTPWSAI